ncbi:MAG: UDP-3-O-(3-hydroxymyristoyl)glucosamine N-acyltransferase, partial [Candidatus Omnitrophica bacterium]|nr:UDP-3-O-(3-hydroxymyristoyl)glucosamine N-acyltransferase [Candidatus Omnitrophota bacterium]
MSKKVKEIARFIGGEVVGDGEILIKGINGINEAREGDLSFLLNIKCDGLLEKTCASCVVVPKTIKKSCQKPLIKVDDPSTAFSKIIDVLFPERIPHPKGVHPTAVISKSARLSRNAAVGPYAVIEDGAEIGDNTAIYPFCYVGKNAKVGKDCIIYPNVTVREEVIIGNRVIIHSGTIVGSDGFGYDVQPDGTFFKIPQVGTVVLEDDVELGACVTIDRARFNKTVIGKGSKIDNLVQIAHNVILGPNCVIAAQTGISGSTELGRNVIFGGQVGVADHLKIGDFVRAGAKTGICKSFPANTTLFWYP